MTLQELVDYYKSVGVDLLTETQELNTEVGDSVEVLVEEGDQTHVVVKSTWVTTGIPTIVPADPTLDTTRPTPLQ